MRVKISKSIRKDLHDEVRTLIERGFQGIASGTAVEVHVKATPVRTFEGTDGTVRRYVDRNRRMSGTTYYGIPSIARTARTTRTLVTMHVPADPEVLSYPYVNKYPGLKTAPECTYADWREELLHLAAHEAWHVRQDRNGGRQSEVQAERRANKQLDGFRS